MSAAAMKATTTKAAAPAAPPSAPAAPVDPQVGGRFLRLPDGSLQPLPDHDEPAPAAPATTPESE